MKYQISTTQYINQSGTGIDIKKLSAELRVIIVMLKGIDKRL